MTHRKDTFCIMPFIHLHNMSNGILKMCCLSEQPFTNKHGQSIFIGNQPIEEVWNGDSIISSRRLMLENKQVPACSHCYAIEDNGGKSLRQEYNEQYLEKNKDIVEYASKNNGHVNKFPSFLELRTGNLCNSACRMCNTNDSSLVYKENTEILKTITNFNKSIGDHIQSAIGDPNVIIFGKSDERVDTIQIDIDRYIDEVIENIDSIDTVTLSGGEPFLLEKTTELLEVMAAKNPNVKLNINTNGSITSDKIINALLKLNDVHLCVSIDGYGKTNEYIRYPLKWDKIENNIQKFSNLKRDGFYLSFNTTVQMLNIFTIDELVKFIVYQYPESHLNLSILSRPFHLNIQNLPTHIKDKIVDRNIKLINDIKDDAPEYIISSIETINSFINAKADDSLYYDTFKSSIIVYDTFRNQSINDYIPVWAKYL